MTIKILNPLPLIQITLMGFGLNIEYTNQPNTRELHVNLVFGVGITNFVWVWEK